MLPPGFAHAAAMSGQTQTVLSCTSSRAYRYQAIVDISPVLMKAVCLTQQVVGAVGWGGKTLDIPPDTDPGLRDIIESCWREPEERPSFTELITTIRVGNQRFSICRQLYRPHIQQLFLRVLWPELDPAHSPVLHRTSIKTCNVSKAASTEPCIILLPDCHSRNQPLR